MSTDRHTDRRLEGLARGINNDGAPRGGRGSTSTDPKATPRVPELTGAGRTPSLRARLGHVRPEAEGRWATTTKTKTSGKTPR